MEMYEKTVSSKPIFKGVIVDLRVDRVTLPNGAEAGREVVSHPGGVCVVPYHDDGTVTVVRQFRYPFGKVITELPAGKLERGEDHRLAGIRELEEETGLTADSFEYLGGLLSSPGFSDEVILTPTNSWSWTGYPLKCCWSRPWTVGFRTPRPWPGC